MSISKERADARWNTDAKLFDPDADTACGQKMSTLMYKHHNKKQNQSQNYRANEGRHTIAWMNENIEK